MKRRLILGLLGAANLVLAAVLASALAKYGLPRAAHSNPEGAAPTVNSEPKAQPAAANRSVPAPTRSVTETPFTQIYAQDGRSFAANLRGIRCPEETIKDILVAEINRRYRAQEEALRPKPADHVPITWSANPSERKLLQRRQQAAAIARKKRAVLRDALGYEVVVPTPVYAMTSSEQQFEDSLAGLSSQRRSAATGVQEDYWSKVQALQERTKGFWLSEDVAELEQLKAERRTRIENLVSSP